MSMHGVVYAVDKPRAERLRDLEDDEEFFQELEGARRLGIGQAWHGLHYLLTGTAGQFVGPQGFLVEGGEDVGPNDGYGPARLFSPREVDDIHGILVGLSDEELWSVFDAARMNAEQVYPFNWQEEPELTRRVYLSTFSELKLFVDEASRRGQYLVVALG